MRLLGKVAIVTGAGKGIGQATAILFAREGARVVLANQTEASASQTLRAIRDQGGEAMVVEVDVSDHGQVVRLMDETQRSYGRLDILVNNAGVYYQGTALDVLDEHWDRVLAVNLTGAFYCSKEAIPLMRDSGGGTIVNVASEAGLVVIPGQVAYNVSKSGLIMLTKSMAVDHARDNIRVNCVCPGTTYTPLVEAALARSGDPVAARRQLESSRPADRLGEPQEIAEGILYLASDASPYATGAVLSIDGGRTAI